MSTAVLPVYARAPLAFERGEGPWLITLDGSRYLDFGAGIAVNSLGHAHPHLVEALTRQAQKLWHTSNIFHIPEGDRLAERLTEATFADYVFFTNSGAEALECAIKMARKYHAAKGNPERNRIITFEGAFHGRTLATIAAGGNPKYTEGFGPSMPGFDHIAPNDLELLKATITAETAAILIEPIQGEGGVRVIDKAFMRGMRTLCDDHGILLIMDEVQTGVGRTGFLFAHQAWGIEPDIMGIAKGIGGGFPLGACLATAEAASGMAAGTHGSTFGGNPLAMAVGNAVLDIVNTPEFLERVKQAGGTLKQALASLSDRFPDLVGGVRGEGLMLGLEAVITNTDIVAAFREAGLITIPAGGNVIRFLPPLIIEDAHIREAQQRMETALEKLNAQRAASA